MKVAEPVGAMVATPSVVVPSLNVTVPEGIGVLAATIAVRTTLSFEIIELADADSVVVVVIGCGTKVTGSVLDPPLEDVTVIDDDGTVVLTTSVPFASKDPRGRAGRLVLAESAGCREVSLDDA